MALKLKQTSGMPLGQFDGYDDDIATIKGGEIGRFIGVPYSFPSTGDKGAFDVFDGYSGTSSKVRPVVSHTLTTTASTYRPLMLLDEGTVGYGTMLGTQVGGCVGQVVPNPSDLSTAPTQFGPHTTSGSGKVTCWATPGLFGVTLDAVASSINPATSTPTPGSPVYANTSGKLTLTSGESFDTGTPTIVGRFVEFTTNGSLVTTTKQMAYGSPVLRSFTEMLFSFRIEN